MAYFLLHVSLDNHMTNNQLINMPVFAEGLRCILHYFFVFNPIDAKLYSYPPFGKGREASLSKYVDVLLNEVKNYGDMH